jgi:hypothetical protein
MSCSNPQLSPWIQFNTFETEANFDFLYIYDNSDGDADFVDSPAASLHGGILPIDFVASGSSAVAHYESDGSVDHNGFNATFTCVDPGTVPPPPPNPCAFDPTTGMVVGVHLIDSGEVNHARLANGQECIWRMSCSNSAWVPQLVFSTFDTESHFDFLYLYDGGDWEDFDSPSLTLHGSSLPRPATASGNEAVARYVSDYSVIRDGFTASFRCIDPNNAQEESGMATDSIVVNGRECPMDAVVLVNNGCDQGYPHRDPEGMVCANDRADDQAYCSYAHSPTSCVYCTEYMPYSGSHYWDDPGVLRPPDYYQPDVYHSPDAEFGDDHMDDIWALLRVANHACPDSYGLCEADPVTSTADGRNGGCMTEVMNMIEYSVVPPPGSLAAALDQCMESAMQSPTVLANVTAILCGGDRCCACTMGCMDDESCMLNCFGHNADGSSGACGAELYDDDYGNWDAGYADPCDACLMGCDGMVDWSQMDSAGEDTWDGYFMCSETCHDPDYGACGGIWQDAADLHPCDACLIGCHEGGDPWLDGEIAIGRPFLLDLQPGAKAHTLAVVAPAVEVAACSSSDWIVPLQ